MSPSENYPDIDKDGLGTSSGIAANDLTCWLATAANMLAMAGYKSTNSGSNINSLQERAQDIYQDFLSWQGTITNSGWIDSALNWWLQSANNNDSENKYSLVTLYGQKTRTPWNNSNGDIEIANHLREGTKVGISISWPTCAPNTIGSGGHAITCVGDNLQTIEGSKTYELLDSSNPPTKIKVVDSDRDNILESDKYIEYDYDAFNNPNPSGCNNGNGWYFSYSNNNPFIKHICTLSTFVGDEQNPLQLISGSYEMNIEKSTEKIYLSYKVNTDVRVYSYKTYYTFNDISYEIDSKYISEISSNQGISVGNSVLVGRVPLNDVVKTGGNITITTNFWVPYWNAIQYEDIYIGTNNGKIDLEIGKKVREVPDLFIGFNTKLLEPKYLYLNTEVLYEKSKNIGDIISNYQIEQTYKNLNKSLKNAIEKKNESEKKRLNDQIEKIIIDNPYLKLKNILKNMNKNNGKVINLNIALLYSIYT